MRNTFVDIDSVKQLISKGGFGHYVVEDLTNGGVKVIGSHLTEEDQDKGHSTSSLIKDFEDKMNVLGSGYFKITLKKAPKTPNTAAVCYNFQIGANDVPQSSDNGLSGISGFGAIDREVENRIGARLESLNKEWDYKLKIDRLEKELEELKNGGVASKGMDALSDLGKMGLGFVIATQAPEAIPMINGMLGYEGGGEGLPEVPKVERPK